MADRGRPLNFTTLLRRLAKMPKLKSSDRENCLLLAAELDGRGIKTFVQVRKALITPPDSTGTKTWGSCM